MPATAQHLVPIEQRGLDPAAVMLVVETTQSHIRIAETARTRVFRSGTPLDHDRTLISQPGRIGHEIMAQVARGDEVTVEKTVAVTTLRDHASWDPGAAAADWLVEAGRLATCLRNTRWRGLACGPGSRSICATARPTGYRESSGCTSFACCRLLAGAAGFAAAILPSRRAAKLNILRVIASK